MLMADVNRVKSLEAELKLVTGFSTSSAESAELSDVPQTIPVPYLRYLPRPEQTAEGCSASGLQQWKSAQLHYVLVSEVRC